MADYAKLATLRPGMPVRALADIVGPQFQLPEPKLKGYYWNDDLKGVTVRIAADDTIGSVAVHQGFPNALKIEGLYLGMGLEEARRLYPALGPDSGEEAERLRRDHAIEPYCGAVNDSVALNARFKDAALIGFDLEAVGVIYPSPPIRNATDRIKHAYDLEMLHRPVDRSAGDNHGWVFGLPPGIATEQWPLDPNTGYPLMHGFTVLLPEDYRCHGPDIVALSFFATAPDQNGGGARALRPLYDAVRGDGSKPADQALATFWQRAQAQHPRLHRMSDILDYEYAVILLNAAEYNGQLCLPPRTLPNAYLARSSPPEWLEIGAGSSAIKFSGVLDNRFEGTWLEQALGHKPDGTLGWNRAIRCAPRAEDPNAGLVPMEGFGEPTDSGYIDHYYYEGGVIGAETHREHAWARSHKPNHIGGTMRPVQAMPEFSPFYIGFEEYFGGHNFGSGGNAQLDFLDMKIDWACG